MKTINLFIISIMLLLITSIVGIADDNFYAVSDNEIITEDFKIKLTDTVTSNLMIDDNNIYGYSNKNFYIINKSYGSISYKLFISNIKNQVQTDNYIYLQTNYNIYKINKNNGTVEDKRIYILLLDNIYSFFGVSGITGSTTINNYYSGTNGTNGTDGRNGTNGTNGINGINGTNGINQSDNTKLNLTGGTMTGSLVVNTENTNSIYGNATNGIGVKGESITNAGVRGLSYNYAGVYGISTNDVGVYGYSVNSPGATFNSGTATALSLLKNLNLNNNNITNCGNCLSNSTMDRNLSNYTNTPEFVTNSTMQSDNTKVNKSGDTMAGNIILSDINSKYHLGYADRAYQTFEKDSNGATVQFAAISPSEERSVFVELIALNSRNSARFEVLGATAYSMLEINDADVNIETNDILVNGNTGQTVDILYLENATTAKTMHFTNGILTSIT